jgi:hypothetical protein
VNDPLLELKRLLLQRLRGIKTRRLGQAKLIPYVKDQKRLGVESAQIERAKEELLREGFIVAMSKGRSYQLTATGEEFLRQPSPPPFGYDEYLLPFQKSYLLLFLLKQDEQKASLSDICNRLRTDNLKRVMGFGLAETDGSVRLNRPLVVWILNNLGVKGAVERIEGRMGAASYRLLEAGRELLGASDQYDTIKFSFSGQQLNALLNAARLAGKTGDGDHHPPVKSPRPTAAQILAEYERLKEERFAEFGMVPIYELRRVVAEHFGADAASHEVLDSLLKDLRREKRIRLVAIGNAGDASQQQLDDSICGENEIYFTIEDAHEPASIG